MKTSLRDYLDQRLAPLDWHGEDEVLRRLHPTRRLSPRAIAAMCIALLLLSSTALAMTLTFSRRTAVLQQAGSRLRRIRPDRRAAGSLLRASGKRGRRLARRVFLVLPVARRFGHLYGAATGGPDAGNLEPRRQSAGPGQRPGRIRLGSGTDSAGHAPPFRQPGFPRNRMGTLHSHWRSAPRWTRRCWHILKPPA